jgi:hypothetical protein
MENKSVTIAGLLLISSTILFDFIFIMNSGFTFNLTSAFLLGALNMMALHFIRVIFKFKIQKEENFLVLIPTIVLEKNNTNIAIVFLNRSLEISLKYKSIDKPTITKL